MLFQNNYWRGMQEPDAADAAINSQKEDLKKKADVQDVGKEAAEAVEAAKKKLPAEKPEDSDKIKTERLQAAKKIEAAKGEFEKILGLVKRKIELKANVAKVDTGKDFLHAHDELVKLEKENEALKKEGLADEPSVAEKRTELSDNADEYYDGLSTKVDEEVGRLKQIDADKLKSEDVSSLMAAVTELQQAKFNKYPGLDSQTDTKDYEEKIKNGVAQLDDSTVKLKDSDLVDSLKRFKFAQMNLAGAESQGAAGKESGHLGGAEQYMVMVLAEQEARRVWGSLPKLEDKDKNWRGDKIGDDPTQTGNWNKDGDNYKNYMAAQKDFNEALKLSANREVGDSAKAAALFKSAAEKWRKVLAEADKKEQSENAALKAEVEKVKSEAVKLKNDLMKTTASRLLEGSSTDWENADKFLSANPPDYQNAKTKYESLITRLKEIQTKYNDLTKYLSTELQKGVDQVLAGNSGDKVIAKNIMFGWVNNIYTHLDEDKKKMWAGLTAINYLNSDKIKMEVWVTTLDGGGVNVDTSGHLREWGEKAVGDLTMDKSEKANGVKLNRKSLKAKIDDAIKYFKEDKTGQVVLQKAVSDFVQDAYRFDGAKNYPKNFDLSKNLYDERVVDVERNGFTYRYSIKAGRDATGKVDVVVKYVGNDVPTTPDADFQQVDIPLDYKNGRG